MRRLSPPAVTAALFALATFAVLQTRGLCEDQGYASRYVKSGAYNIHYKKGGEDTGTTFLFVHGNASSSYLWRNVMPYLETLGQVIAIDLVGAGKSDKPKPGLTFQQQYSLTQDFIDTLELRNIVFVAHDWGGPLAMEYARRNPENVKGLVMMEVVTPPRFPLRHYSEMGDVEDIFRSLRDKEEGRRHVVNNSFIETLLVGDLITREMTEEEKDNYRAPFKKIEDRESLYMWPNELPIEGVPARNVEAFKKIEDWLKRSDVPKLLFYFSPGAIISGNEAFWMQENYANFTSIFLGTGRHYVQEEQAESIGRNIHAWYGRTFPAETGSIH